MKAKTTPRLYLQDFAKNAVSATALFFVLLFATSFDGYGQVYPNGRSTVTTQQFPVTTNPYGDEQVGVTPFSTNTKSARIQYRYTNLDFSIGGLPNDNDKISSVAFYVVSMGDPLVFSNITIRAGYVLANGQNFKIHGDIEEFTPTADFVEVYSSSRTISQNDLSPDNINALGGWVTFPFNDPDFNVKRPVDPLQHTLIIELSYTFANYDDIKGQQVNILCSKTSSDGQIMTRSVFLEDESESTVLGKDLFTGIADGKSESNKINRRIRPYTRFIYRASAANTQNVEYSVTNSQACPGEDVTVTISNCFADGFTYNWQMHDGSNYVDVSPVNNTNTYTATQQIEDQKVRCQLILPGGGYGFGANANKVVRGINQYLGLGVWSYGQPAANGESAYFKSDYTISDDVNYCTVVVGGGATVKVASGKTLTLSQNLNVAEGSFMKFFNNSSLIQSDTNAVNVGKIEYQRITPSVNRYDYTYYSSPVIGQTLYHLSEDTLFDKFWSYFGDEWQMELDLLQPMQPGKGYIIRAPQTYTTSGVGAPFEAYFKGIPSNGTIQVDINPNVGAFNLVGNPYPSAVDSFLFTDLNSSILEGTVYVWNHEHGVSSTPNANGIYEYDNTDYAALNLTGGTNGLNGSIIGAGQSFMVQTRAGAGLSPVAKWKNSHRVTSQNGVIFYKNAVTSEQAIHLPSPKPAGRIWLKLEDVAGKSQKMLLGYINGATEEYDNGFDGKQLQTNGLGLYGLTASQENMAILAKGMPFNDEEVVHIGFSASTTGAMSLSKFLEDGFFADYVVFVNDRLTNTLHNLSESAYAFNSAAGTFNERFVLAFKRKEFAVQNPDVRPLTVVVYDKAEAVQLHSNKDLIKNVIVYDMAGRVIARKQNCNSLEVALASLTRSNRLILVEIHLENGTVETQKFQF